MHVALSSYRSKPHSGGQGIYVRHLSRELHRLGHDVTVFSGQPYPELDLGVRLVKVPSLDLYNDANPFRHPHPREFRDHIDVAEYLGMLSGTFPEPRTFGMRLHRELRTQLEKFDVLHDNQTLAPGVLALTKLGLPTVTTIHHPISADRRLEIDAAKTLRQRYSKWRWYSFVPMQARVARHSSRIITVSEQSRADIINEFHVKPERIDVVPVGVDVDAFRPGRVADSGRPGTGATPARLTTITSANVPLKGLSVLIEALAELPAAAWRELVVVGTPNREIENRITALNLAEKVTFRSGISDDDLADLLSSATVHVVPSLYEGFSLPAVEAMACGTPLVATRVGALPQLVNGRDNDSVRGTAGKLVPPGDASALAEGIVSLLDAPLERERMGEIGRRRAEVTYSWHAVAAATAAIYTKEIAC